MSGMNYDRPPLGTIDHLFLGKPFTSDVDTPPPIEPSAVLLAEIEGTGVTVTRIHQVDTATPLRFYIRFPPGEPMVAARLRLEKLHFDVGQKLGGKELSFYATKRTKQTKGWDE